jgi:heavy metal translocating P-type ATPase
MNENQKKMIRNIIIAAVLFIAAIITTKISEKINRENYQGFNRLYMAGIALFIASYIIVGLPVLKKAFYNMKRGRVFDENFLMGVATIGAFGLREFAEGVAVMLFYTVGEFFQSMAVNKSRKAINELMDIRPDYANLKLDDGSLSTVDPYEVSIGDIIIVKPGERIPLDGEVIKGESMLDTSALTGEPVLRRTVKGDKVLSGSINTDGVLEIKVEKEFSDSTASRILDLVENAASKKSESENFITKFALVYTPLVAILALIIAIIFPLIDSRHDFALWISRALTFLVVSCPCALVISIPLSFFGGVGAASRLGILVKGSNYLEAIAKTETAVFDKTGTLTEGVFELTEIVPASKEIVADEFELLEIAAYAECYSSHPIALSIKKAYMERSSKDGSDAYIDESRLSEIKEISGKGLKVKFDDKAVLIGNAGLMKENRIFEKEMETKPGIVHTAIDGKYSGYLIISDKIKKDSKKAMEELKKLGVKQTVMLTGDGIYTAESVGKEIGIDEVYAGLLPGDKLDKLEELLNKKQKNNKLVFVGDGINDAPVLARADIGVAMGGLGSDAAIEAADIVIMNDEPSKLATGIRLARRTIKIANQNIVIALGIKIAVLILAVFGIANMWSAVFADVGVTIIAIFNSMRNLNTKAV